MTIDGRRTLKKNRWLYFFKERKNINDNKIIEKRQPLMVDSLWWKIVFDGRSFLVEDGLWWKTTFDGRHSLMKDTLWWKTHFDGRQPMNTSFDGIRPLMENCIWPLMEDAVWCRTTFYGNHLLCKSTFNDRWPLMKDVLSG